MEIQQIKLLKNQAQSSSRYNRSLSNNKSDSFEKVPVISFRASNPAQNIITNPDLMNAFAKFLATGLAAGFAALAGKSVLSSIQHSDESSDNFLSELLNSLSHKNVNEQHESQKSSDEQLKLQEELEKENQALKQQVIDLKNQLNMRDTISDEPEPNSEKEINATFPKKRGKLSNAQKDLKNLVETLTFPKNYAQKLTIICENLLQKGTKIIDNKSVDNNDIIKELVSELSGKQDNHKEVIDKFYILCGQEAKKNANTQNVSSRKRIPSVASSDTDQNDLLEVKSEIEDSFLFKLPKPMIGSLDENLSTLISVFESKFYKKLQEEAKKTPDVPFEKPRWKYNYSVWNMVRKEDIKKEIYTQNVKYKNSNTSSCYKNIDKVNPEVLADIINSDARYNKFFTIHSALRLIDRFLDLDSDVDYEVQSKKIIDKLFELIQNSFEKGVLVEVYNGDKNHYAPRLVIPASDFDEEAREIFGSLNLKITFCEKQYFTGYNPYGKKNGLICTIFSSGI